MTLEELEAYIAEQKAALEQAERDRRITRGEARKVSEELERRKAREAELRQEVRTLCVERVEADADGAGDDPGRCGDGSSG